VLGQDGVHALHAAQHGAVHDHGALGAGLGRVGQVKPLLGVWGEVRFLW
jgi:hypothetical protein